jgi:hypothetical protein
MVADEFSDVAIVPDEKKVRPLSAGSPLIVADGDSPSILEPEKTSSPIKVLLSGFAEATIVKVLKTVIIKQKVIKLRSQVAFVFFFIYPITPFNRFVIS